MDPFLDLTGFTALWDGPGLTTQQQGIVALLLQVASDWIYARRTDLAAPQGPQPPTDATAKLVCFEVVSNVVRYGKYAPLSSYHRATGHRVDAGTMAAEVQRYFTDDHKMLLGIPLLAPPVTTCRRNDFDADDMDQGWPTFWSDQFGNRGWDWWEADFD